MTAVSYKSYSPIQGERCGICLGKKRDEDWVAHEGEGNKHPLHHRCAAEWARTNNNDSCPTCKVKTDNNSLFPWKERTLNELKLMGRDAKLAAVLGLGLGVLAVEVVEEKIGTPVAAGLSSVGLAMEIAMPGERGQGVRAGTIIGGVTAGVALAVAGVSGALLIGVGAGIGAGIGAAIGGFLHRRFTHLTN